MVYEHDETPDPYEPDMLATPSGRVVPPVEPLAKNLGFTARATFENGLLVLTNYLSDGPQVIRLGRQAALALAAFIAELEDEHDVSWGYKGGAE